MKKFNRAIRIGGHKRVINSITIQALDYDGDGNILRASGTTVPTGGAGYAKGCLFMKTDVATGTKGLYENEGTVDAASFNLVGAVSAGEITLAQGNVLVGNASGVGVALNAKGDTKILVGNATTITSVAMSGHATLANDGVLTLNLGTSGTPLAHTAYTESAYEVHTTQSDTNAASYEPVLFSTQLTGAGQAGGRVRAYMKTNVKLGGWANAFKAEVDFMTNGAITGLASALVAEMTMPGSAPAGGNYGVLEIELNCPANFDAGAIVALSFMHLSTQGATVAEMDNHGFLMNIQGLTAGSGDLYQTGNTQAGNVSGSLKIKVLNAIHYITLYDAEATTS